MTIRELKELINEIADADLDNLVVLPSATDMPGMFMFEDVCPGVTEMITLGPPPDFVGADSALPEGTRVFLIAPHSFHDEEHDHEKGKEILN